MSAGGRWIDEMYEKLLGAWKSELAVVRSLEYPFDAVLDALANTAWGKRHIRGVRGPAASPEGVDLDSIPPCERPSVDLAAQMLKSRKSHMVRLGPKGSEAHRRARAGPRFGASESPECP